MTTDEHIEMRKLAYEHSELKGINSGITDFIEGYKAAYRKFKTDQPKADKTGGLKIEIMNNLICDKCHTHPIIFIDRSKKYLKCACGKFKYEI